MENRLRKAIKALFNRGSAGHMLTILPDDIFIVSYPKSGNTWLRFLIANLIAREQDVSFSNIENLVPDIYQNTDSELLKTSRPRILKSHSAFDPRYKKVVYIARDPRDIVVSYYHHHIKFTKFDDNRSINEFIDEFVSGSLDRYGNWGENVGSWIGALRGTNKLLLVRYEDLISRGAETLINISSYLGMNVSKEKILDSLSACTFERMKAMERKQSGKWKPLNNTRIDKNFIRRGCIGEWELVLERNAINKIESAWHDQMATLGYL